jgi:GAF domain-containing protein
MLQKCTEVMVKYLDAAFARIWAFNPAENMLELRASAGMYTHIDGGHARVPVGKFKIGLIAQERVPHLTNDVLNDPRLGDKAWAKQEGMVAFAGYPLVVESRLVGVMAMFARHSLQDDVLQAMSAVANTVALSIERNKAEQIVAKRATELAAVAQVGTAAATILKTDELLHEVVNLTKSSFDLYHAHIYLLNEKGDKLNLVAGAGTVGEQMVQQGWNIPLQHEHSLVARATRTRRAVIVNDIRQDPDFLPNPLLPETRSEMAVPLIVGDTVLGVLDVQADVVNRFTEEDILIETTLAGQVAVALENARLFEKQRILADETEDQAHRQALLSEMGVVLAATTNLNEVFQIVSTRTNKVVAGDLVTIALLDEAGDSFEYYTLHDTKIGTPDLVLERIILSRVIRENQVVTIPDLQALDVVKPREWAKQGFHSAIIAPLVISGQAIGTIYVINKKRDAYSAGDERLIRQIASLLASAIESRRLLEQTQTRARRERILREITTRVRSSVDPDTIMRTAVEEVGRALGRPAFVYLGNHEGQSDQES